MKSPPKNQSTGYSNNNPYFSDNAETRKGRQPACCTGLTIDLLIELMKDLNFEVELYEVEDRLWGGWTVSMTEVNST